MFPVNQDALQSRMSGKSGLYQVIKGEAFMKTGRVVSRIPHLVDYPDGYYRVGDSKPQKGEYDVASHFEKLEACIHTLHISLNMLWEIYDSVKSWRRCAGKEAREIKMTIAPEMPNKDWIVLKIFGEGKFGEYGALVRTFHIKPEGSEIEANFRFQVPQFLDFLYMSATIRDKKPTAELLYQDDKSQFINDKPLFIRFEAYDREILVGHQVVSELDMDSDDDLDDGKKGIKFLDKSGEVKADLIADSPKAQSTTPVAAPEPASYEPAPHDSKKKTPKREDFSLGTEKVTPINQAPSAAPKTPRPRTTRHRP